MATMFKATCYLRWFGITKVPLIFLLRPKVLQLGAKTAEVKIPLNYLSRNHLKSMYFGSLAIGADCVGGIMAMSLIDKSKKKISIVFKDFKADFLKRPEADTHFICDDGEKIQKMIDQTIQTGERVNEPLHIIATCPKKLGNEPVAKFVLTLSIKLKK